MRILFQKEEKEIEKIKEENKFLKRGYRAISRCLDYEKIIVSILKTLDIKQIELEDYLMLNKETIQCYHTENNTTIIRLFEEK